VPIFAHTPKFRKTEVLFMLSVEAEPCLIQTVPSDIHDILCGVEQQEALSVAVYWFTVIALLGVFIEYL